MSLSELIATGTSDATILIAVMWWTIRRILELVHDHLDIRQFKRSTPAQRRDLIEYRRSSRTSGSEK